MQALSSRVTRLEEGQPKVDRDRSSIAAELSGFMPRIHALTAEHGSELADPLGNSFASLKAQLFEIYQRKS